jgi:hypothetical protein
VPSLLAISSSDVVGWILTDNLVYAQDNTVNNTVNLSMYVYKTADTFRRTIISNVPQEIKANSRGKRHRALCENSASLHQDSFIGLSPNREIWAGVANSLLPFTHQPTP